MAQADPNYLWYTPFGEPKGDYEKRGWLQRGGGTGNAVPPATRRAISKLCQTSIRRWRAPSSEASGQEPDEDVHFPGIADGVAVWPSSRAALVILHNGMDESVT